MKRYVALVVLGLAALVFAAAAGAKHQGGGGVKISGPEMTGAQECNDAGVCGLGDPDGSGAFFARINIGQSELCYTLTVANIDPATAAHIHIAPAGIAGPVVIPLAAPTTGSSAGCITGLDRDLLKAIAQNPAAYYVNVHNTAFPGGAVRDQLEKG
jgi:hypothetical protein